MKRCAIIDDYQRCALEMGDWSELADEDQIVVFDIHVKGEGEGGKHLGGFEIIGVMQERTSFLRTQLEKLPYWNCC